MRLKFLIIIAAVIMVFSFSFSAPAQTLTNDIVFLKAGWIPLYTIDYEETGLDNAELGGFAIQGEYNLNFNKFWLGLGVEYQRLVENDKAFQFILPMVSAKFAAMGGLYVGAGLAGKYMIAADKFDNGEYDKKIDLWLNVLLGYYAPIGEAVFVNLEGRFGYNLTNQQFSEGEYSTGQSFDIDIKSQYDIAFYIGIGYRASMSDY